jgi:hypothetical protein
MKITLPDAALNQIFGAARTHGAWLDKPSAMRFFVNCMT